MASNKSWTSLNEFEKLHFLIAVRPFLIKIPRKSVSRYHILKPAHTSRVFVVALQSCCRGQIGLNFVGPSACRTLPDFLSRLTTLRLGAESSKIKMVPIPLTRRKLKLALFTSTFLRRIEMRRKSSTRTT